MPNFQGAVNEVINQAGLYSALAGGPQDLKERIKLGKEEKIVGKQLENVGRDLSETTSRAKAAQASGDHDVARELGSRSRAMGEELLKVGENLYDIKERKYQLNPSEKNYEEYMKFKRGFDGQRKRISEGIERSRRMVERDERRAEFERARSQQLKEAAKKQKEEISSYIGNLPTSLGGKVKDLKPEFKEKVIQKYMEADDGKQE